MPFAFHPETHERFVKFFNAHLADYKNRTAETIRAVRKTGRALLAAIEAEKLKRERDGALFGCHKIRLERLKTETETALQKLPKATRRKAPLKPSR